MSNKHNNEMNVSFIPVSKINTNPYQPRKFFSKTSLSNLTDSIKKYGLLQPIAVRKINHESYEIVAGERRYRACKLLNIDKIPAIIINLSQKECLYITMIENIQRSNLNYIEEAEGIKNIMLDCSMSIENLAAVLDQSEDYILRKLYLLNLPKGIQTILLQNNLPEEFAFALLKLNDEHLQHEVLDKIIYYGLSINTAKNLIDKTIERSISSDSTFKNKSVIKDLRIFFNTIKQAVNVTKASGFDTKYIINEQSGNIEISIKIDRLAE